ncbi:MAG: lipid-binding SYLF domain-containing protein [Syntrophales bacterium]|jgi:lipid-binding SYLF domain-containing protein|nr:lipid-binding SYLF domain-containing protein [Syntrophales bacterium]
MKRLPVLLLAAAVLAVLFTVPGPAAASDKADAQATVTKANITFNSFMSDKNFTEMRKLSRSAKGIFIAPQVLKGAFVVGASGGTGVLLVRAGDGKWTYPAFYTIGSVSFGFQIGGQASEVILLAMTERGVTTLLQSSVKLGADVGLAAGPYGAGAQAATANISADILAFSRSKGLYGGISLDGAVVDVRDSLNKAYYGKTVTPTDILVKQAVSNAQADTLRASVAKISGVK